MDLKALKADLKKKTDREPEKFYPVRSLKENGFHRSHCAKCGKYFWTAVDSKICGDPNCTGGYTFIGQEAAKKKMDFIEVWKEFSSLFKKLGYTPIKRFPVVARWRDDAYWNNASIYDFQPYVVNGEVEPPANPLVVPQPCARFNDIDNVGITGRHYTSFVMIGQHAFYPKEKFEQEKYFSDILTWLEKGIGLQKEVIKFHEDQWGGGGNMGVSMEFFAHGLEIGNQVYMTYEVTESGNLRDLKLNVLDMGMGQERPAWLTHGTNTSYEANFPTVVKELYAQTGIKPDHGLVKRFLPYSGMLNFEEAEDLDKTWGQIADKLKVDVQDLKDEILKLGAIYSIADHTRTLLFAITDGALPSNVGGQYNLRVIYRRIIGFIAKYGWPIDIEGIIEAHAKYLKPQYPELSENLGEIYKILRIEREKYIATAEKSRKIVRQLIEKTAKISDEKFAELYDSQGITPELIEEEAKKLNVRIKTPENFYALAAQRHPEMQAASEKKAAAKEIDVSGLQETYPAYYDDTKLLECKSKVLKVIGKYVVLDKTVFYPTGGGQQNDTGTINSIKVLNAEKIRNVILHEAENPKAFKEGDSVNCVIDADRRMRLARNHDAAHILGGAARKILGRHIWQAGSQIDTDKGRLDITHYASPTEIEKYEIEKLANKIISEKRKIIKKLTPRNEAEEKFGFTLYQGGAVPGKAIRVVSIENFDTQACGGTHLDNTGEVEGIKITKAEKIQDGVIRLVFVAGKGLLAEKEFNEKELVKSTITALEKFGVKIEKAGIAELGAAAQVFSVKAADMPKTFERFFSEMKDNSENIDDLEKLLGIKVETADEQFIEGLNRAHELAVIGRMVFERWKAQRKHMADLEKQFAARHIELMAKAHKIGNINLVVEKIENFGLATRVANAILEKEGKTLVILPTEDKILAAAGKEVPADCTKILSSIMQAGTKISGDSKRAIAVGKLEISEKDTVEKIRKVVGN